MVFLDIKCQGQKVSYQQKEYSLKYENSGTHCWNFIRKVKVFKKWVKLQGHRVKMLVPTESSCHKEYSCKISKL